MPVPDNPAKRYDASRRWTGILQSKLESKAIILEEGLPSRTINKDDPRPGKFGRNGSTYLFPCISSHVPLDAVVIWLGTNDTKDVFDSTAEEIAIVFRQMLAKLQVQLDETSPGCKLVILSPPQMNPDSEGAKAWYGRAQSKLAALPAQYDQIAHELGIEYIDMYTQLGMPAVPDGIHLSEAQNLQVADLVYRKLLQIGAL